MSNITKNDCELEKQFDNINTDKFDKTPTPCSSLLSDNKSKHYIQYDNNSSKRKIRLRSNTLFAFQDDHIYSNIYSEEGEDFYNNDPYFIPNNTLNSSNFFSTVCDKSQWIKLDTDTRTNYDPDHSINSITDDMERQLDFLNEVDDLNDAKLSLDDNSIISDNFHHKVRETIESEDMKNLNTQQSFSSFLTNLNCKTSNGSSFMDKKFNQNDIHAKSVDLSNQSPFNLTHSVYHNKYNNYNFYQLINDESYKTVLNNQYLGYSFCNDNMINNYNYLKYPFQIKPDDKALLDNLMFLIKDQNGCRVLQKKFEERRLEFFKKFYDKIKNNLIEIFVDQFGNYVIQKFIECCPDKNIISTLLDKINKQLYYLATNSYGTRALQKLLDNIVLENDFDIIKEFLLNNMFNLIRDINGNHVVQKILQIVPNNQDSIYNEMLKHIIDVSKLKQGGCIFQKCLERASIKNKNILIEKIIDNIKDLINDEYGNFIIQHIINLKIDEYNQQIYKFIITDVSRLSKQKYSSNVIDKIILHEDYILKTNLIDKLIEKKLISELILDQFGNYVVQKALQVTSGQKFIQIIDMISKVLKQLRQTNYGKKIYENLMSNYGEHFNKAKKK